MRNLYEPSFVRARFLNGHLSEAVTKYLWTKEVSLFQLHLTTTTDELHQ